MSRITQNPSVAPLEVFQQATSASTGTGQVDPSFATYVGQRYITSDGREVCLVANAATALVSANLIQSSAVIANHQNLAVAVPTATPATAGTFQVSVTLGATVLNSQQYQGGFLLIDSGTGLGQTLRIASNPAAAASASGVIITLEDPIQVTLDATSTVCLVPNPYINVVINPTTATAAPIGVSFYPVAASTLPTYNGTSGANLTAGTLQYALIVTKGLTGCLADATTAAVGLGLCASTTTAGCVTLQTTTGANVGRAQQATVSAKARAIFVDV